MFSEQKLVSASATSLAVSRRLLRQRRRQKHSTQMSNKVKFFCEVKIFMKNVLVRWNSVFEALVVLDEGNK